MPSERRAACENAKRIVGRPRPSTSSGAATSMRTSCWIICRGKGRGGSGVQRRQQRERQYHPACRKRERAPVEFVPGSDVAMQSRNACCVGDTKKHEQRHHERRAASLRLRYMGVSQWHDEQAGQPRDYSRFQVRHGTQQQDGHGRQQQRYAKMRLDAGRSLEHETESLPGRRPGIQPTMPQPGAAAQAPGPRRTEHQRSPTSLRASRDTQDSLVSDQRIAERYRPGDRRQQQGEPGQHEGAGLRYARVMEESRYEVDGEVDRESRRRPRSTSRTRSR